MSRTDRVSDSFSDYAIPERWRWTTKLRRNPTFGLSTNDFVQTVSASVIPPGVGRRGGPKVVELEPDDNNLKRAVARGISERQHDLDDAVWHFSHHAVLSLLTFGRVPYEVFSLGGDGSAGNFGVASIPPFSVLRIGHLAIQFIPADRLRGGGKGRWVGLPKDRIVWLEMPRARRGQISHLLQNLAWHDSNLMPDLQQFWRDPVGKETIFDSQGFIRGRRVALGVITRDIGWRRGSDLDETTTEYFRWVRQLRYQEFLADIRERLLSVLNQCLRVAASQLGAECELRFRGLPTREQIARAREELRAGERPFSEIFSFIRY